MLSTGPLDDSAISYAKAFMATPKKKNPKDTSSSVENSEIDGSSESDAGQETEASDKSFNESDISGSSDTKDSETQESYQDLPARHSRKSAADTKQSFQGHIRPSRKGRYNVPTESKKVQDKAAKRIDDALNQVPSSVHMNLESQRTTKTLYVGNLDYNSDSNLLFKTLRKYFRYRIKVDKVMAPENNGKSRGYAFVTLSWVKAANVNPSDI